MGTQINISKLTQKLTLICSDPKAFLTFSSQFKYTLDRRETGLQT